MDTASFIIHIKTEDIANDVKKWFDTSNYSGNDKKTTSDRYEQEGNWINER